MGEGDSDTLTLASYLPLNIFAWSDAWTDENGSSLATNTVYTDAGDTDTYSDPVSSELVATVSAYDESGNSFTLPPIIADVVLTAPTGLYVTTFSSNQINLSWTNESALATDVNILESTNGGNYSVFATVPATDAGTDSSYSAMDLTSGTQYEFEVKSVFGGNVSPTSNYALATTTAAGQPTNLSATEASPNEVDLSWAGYSPANATAFNIFVSADGVNFTYFDSISSDATTYQALGLAPDTTYTFEVTAGDTTNQTPFTPSNEASATTLADPWGVQTGGPSSVVEGETYSLNLSAATPNASPTLGYFTVDWGDGSTPSDYSAGTTIATHVFATGIDSTIIQVTASTTAGVASPLTVTPGPIEVDMVPLAPTNVQAVANSQSGIDLSWTDASEDADGYTVYRSTDNGASYQDIANVAGTADSYSDMSLAPGTAALYSVQATGLSSGDISSISTALASVIASFPTGQPTLTVQASPTVVNAALLTYTYQGTDDLGFEVEMEDQSVGENFHWIATEGAVGWTGTGTMTVTGLNVADTYDFRIRADHAGGTASRYTDSGLWTFPAIGAPDLSVNVYTETINSLAGVPINYKRVRLGWSGILSGESIGIEVSGAAWPGNEWHTVWYGYQGTNGSWPGDIQQRDALLPNDTTDQGYVLDPGVPSPGAYSFRVRSFSSSGIPGAWSQPQTVNLNQDGVGFSPSFSGTSTSITATWPAGASPESADSTIYMQAAGAPGIVGREYGFLSVPAPQDNAAGTELSTTITGLTPGTTYEFSLWTHLYTRQDFDAVPDWAFQKGSFTTDGAVPLIAPAAPAGLHPVDLGDGVSNPQVELIWQNIPNNEDGYIIEESIDPNFLADTQTYRVGADVTNFIDSPFYTGTTIYYRVASFRGNAQSAWANTSILQFRSPVAMAISWIPGNGAYIPFDLTSNSPPPSVFNNNGYSSNDFNVWRALDDFRNILSVQVGIRIDPYTGTIVSANPNTQKYVGYTPVAGVSVKGQGPNASVTTSYNADHTQVTVTVLAKFRVASGENFLFGLSHFHRLAWAWAKISYTINTSGSASAVFSGSLVPSQTDYWNEVSGGGYQMTMNPSPFNSAAYGSLGPTSGVQTTLGGN